MRPASVTLDLVIGPKGEPGIVRAALENVEVEALKGIDSSMMRPAESACSPWLMPSGASFIFNSAMHPAHGPAVLLTVFTL